jgi:hypothetical protein
LTNSFDDEYGFTKVKVEVLFQNNKFNEMLNDFCNNKYDRVKFFKDCFDKVLEQAMQGKLIGDIINGEIEIKNDNTKIKNDITDLLSKRNLENPSTFRGVTYIEIMQHIQVMYNHFYTNDYLKFIIGKLLDDGIIQELAPNSYGRI